MSKIEYQEGEDGKLYPLNQVSNNPNLKEDDLGKYGAEELHLISKLHMLFLILTIHQKRKVV